MDEPRRKRWGGRRGRRPSDVSPESSGPGVPSGEARLLAVREEPGGVEVVLDTGHAYTVATGSLPGLPEVGDIVPPDLTTALAAAATRKMVAREILAQLDRRLQPMARLRGRMVDRGHDPEAVDAVLEQLEDKGLHSDRRYAEAFCRDCLLSKAVGRRYLVQKLREKRVAVDLASRVAEEILDSETERELADRAAADRWRRQRGPADRNALAKVVRFLVGRGFAVGLANEAARRRQPAPEAEGGAEG